MNIPAPILLAGIGDLLVAILPLLYAAFWIFSQFAEAKRKADAETKRRPRPQQQQAAQRAAPAPPRDMARQEAGVAEARPAGDNVRAEVEEFLRRVRQQGQGQERPAQPASAEPRRPRIEVLVDESEEGFPSRQQRPAAPPPIAQRSTATQTQVPTPSSVPSKPMEPFVEASPVAVPLERRHLTEGALTEHARHLGEQIGQSDERLETHLHQKFDHALGKLAAREATPAEQVASALATTPASEIAALLATPQGMQQAVVLSEILQRPTDRW